MTNDYNGLSQMRDIKTGAYTPLVDSQKGFKGQLEFICKRFSQIKSWHKESEGGIRLLSCERVLTHSEFELKVFNCTTGECINSLEICDESGEPLEIDNSSIVILSKNQLACRHEDGIIRVWNWQTGEIISLCESTPDVDRAEAHGYAAITSPDYSIITSGAGAQTVDCCQLYDKSLVNALKEAPFTHLFLSYYFLAYPEAFSELLESSELARSILESCDIKIQEMISKG